jgi:hypothetical protein
MKLEEVVNLGGGRLNERICDTSPLELASSGPCKRTCVRVLVALSKASRRAYHSVEPMQPCRARRNILKDVIREQSPNHLLVSLSDLSMVHWTLCFQLIKIVVSLPGNWWWTTVRLILDIDREMNHTTKDEAIELLWRTATMVHSRVKDR